MARATYKVTNDYKAQIVARLEREKIAYWQIAEYFGVHDNTVVRWMRNPDQKTAQDIMSAIDAISSQSA
jgi:transposase-like protein